MYITDTQLAASNGSSLVGFVQPDANAVARTAEAKLREIVSVVDFGAVGDGTTDSTTAIQNAIDFCSTIGRRLFFPTGSYLLSGTLTIAAANLIMFGEGSRNSLLVASTSDPMLLVSGHYGLIQDIGFQGGPADNNRIAPHGIVFQDAAGSYFDRCAVYWCASHGVRFDPVWNALPDGNNTNIAVTGGDYVSNDGSGLWVELHPTNNDINFLGVNSSSNAGHGIMLKGIGNVVDRGNFFANIGYGIQISESADLAVSANNRILNAWIEANFAGGVRGGGQSARNIYYQKNNEQGYSAASGSTDIYLRSTGGSILDLYGNGSEVLQATGASGTLFMSAGNVTGTGNYDWWFSAQGAGSLTMNSPVNFRPGIALRFNGVTALDGVQTGWAAPTGTATRAAFNTTTVTLPQLAERVKALIDDFRNNKIPHA